MSQEIPTISLSHEDKKGHRDEVFNGLEETINPSDPMGAYARKLLAILGLIPFTQGILSFAAGSWGEAEQDNVNKVIMEWLRLQKAEVEEISRTVFELMERLDLGDEETRKRVESPEYLRLMRRAFRNWSAAESETKREAIRNLLSHAGSTKICTDEVLNIFLGWIEWLNEMHFAVIKAIYKEPESSRADIWDAIGGRRDVTDNSAEADLFKFLIDELTRARIIRQQRMVNRAGQFVKSKPVRKPGRSSTMLSAFEDGKPYVLTELGQQFVHYCLTDVVRKIRDNSEKTG